MEHACCRILPTAAAVVLCAFSSLAATTYYVDCNRPDDAGDGKTESTAFRTIQAAVNKASSGDTVKVLPGVYDEGGDSYVNGTAHSNRVQIVGKRLTIESTGGKDVTHIVGQADPVTGDVGDGAVRCVFMQGNDALGTTVRGFTLRDGYGSRDTNHKGGGILQLNGNRSFYIIDCVISNCMAVMGGAMRGGTAIRCQFSNNSVVPKSVSADYYAGVGYDADFWNCLIVNNPTPGGVNSIYNAKLVNCTLTGNGGYSAIGVGCSLYNCILSGNGSGGAVDIGDETIRQKALDNGCVLGAAYANMGPAVGDWRVVRAGAADGAGDPARLTDKITLPSGLEMLDYNGRKIDVTGGAICAGCIQETAVAAGGKLLFDGTIGYGSVLTRVAGSYAQAELGAYPRQWRFWAPATTLDGTTTKYLACLKRTTGNTVFPTLDGSFVLVSPPTGVAVTLTTTYWKGLWVDEKAAAGGTGTEAAPYQTIQAAVDAGGSGSIVFVRPGTYRTGGVTSDASPHYGASRVSLVNGYTLVRAVEGPESTFIVGASDATADGNGANAVRCVNASSASSAVQGFTLTGGRVKTSGGQPQYGGAMRGSGQVLDCVVSNNTSVSGPVFYASYLSRCRIDGNVADGDSLLANGAVASSCWFGPNNRHHSSNYYGVFGSGTIGLNCTLVKVSAASFFSVSAHVFNSVAVLGDRLLASMDQAGNVFWNFTATDAGAVFTRADPLLAPDGVHPYAKSTPCVGAGASLADGDATKESSFTWSFWRYATADVDGNDLVFDAEGRGMAGCAQTVDPHVYIGPADGPLASATGVTGLVKVADDAPLTVVATRFATRPCAGYSVASVTNLFDTSSPISAADVVAWGGAVLAPVYTADLYVDALNGDDARLGFTPKTAKRTLADVMTNSVVAIGDTVHAAPGRYDRGTMIQSDAKLLRARVVVPAGVTLVADRGPDVTAIVGESAQGADDLYHGCGAGAVRCVYLTVDDAHHISRVRGFTLSGGHTLYYDRGDSELVHYNADNSAGGVHGRGSWACAYAFAEDCVITNCAGYRGGGARSVTLRRCRIVDCRADWGGAAATETVLQGCIEYGNFDRDDATAFGKGGAKSVFQPVSLTDCTVMGGVSSLTDEATVRNTFVGGFAHSRAGTYYRCAFAEGCGIGASDLNDGSFVAPAAQFAFDAQGRPVGGANALCDKANAAYSAEAGLDAYATDCSGFQRVMNGAQDIGALEGDWRERYGRDLSHSRKWLRIVEATPDVTSTAERTVRVPSGERVSATWKAYQPGTCTYVVHVRVTGGGSFAVTANGETVATVTAADGLKTISFDSAATVNELAFAFGSGEGVAELSEFIGGACGCLLLVR